VVTETVQTSVAGHKELHIELLSTTNKKTVRETNTRQASRHSRQEKSEQTDCWLLHNGTRALAAWRRLQQLSQPSCIVRAAPMPASTGDASSSRRWWWQAGRKHLNSAQCGQVLVSFPGSASAYLKAQGLRHKALSCARQKCSTEELTQLAAHFKLRASTCMRNPPGSCASPHS
jgi:hypothetical protein